MTVTCIVYNISIKKIISQWLVKCATIKVFDPVPVYQLIIQFVLHYIFVT